FRIKIWIEVEETGEEIIIYDNLLGAEDDSELDWTTEIGGGSIVIHKPSVKHYLYDYPPTVESSLSTFIVLLSIASIAFLNTSLNRKKKKL
ncbi:MAG: hypothetical protein ACTSUP_04355, partial [Candidatus Heimdallarchaeaceae archaeon]